LKAQSDLFKRELFRQDFALSGTVALLFGRPIQIAWISGIPKTVSGISQNFWPGSKIVISTANSNQQHQITSTKAAMGSKTLETEEINTDCAEMAAHSKMQAWHVIKNDSSESNTTPICDASHCDQQKSATNICLRSC